jgi:competence protein ComEC
MPTNFSNAALGFLVGVWFASLWSWGLVWPLFILFLAFVFWLARFFFLNQTERKLIGGAALFLFCFALGGGRGELSLLNQNSPDWLAGQTVTVTGEIVEEPKPGATTNQVVLVTPENYRLLLITDLYPEYRYGDRLKVSGQLVQPKNFFTETGREFDYVNYLGRQKIYYEMFRPQIEVLANDGGHWFGHGLIWLRGQIMSGIAKVLPEPQAGLLGGLLIGARQSLDRETMEQFRRVGLSHMVVLSGYNLTIVAEAIRAALVFLPFYAGLGAAGIGIALFALMAGGGAAVGRAALMALLALLARATGRIYEVTRALVVTIIVLLLWNPNYLVFDLGFQLSILATLGLLFLSPLVEVWFTRAPEKFGLREILASTVAAQLAVLPWLLYKLGELSLVSFAVNPLALVVVPTIMLFGFFTSLFSFISVWLAFLPGSIAYLFLSYQLSVVSFFSHLSFASITISNFPLAAVILVYSSYLYWYHRKTRGHEKISR